MSLFRILSAKRSSGSQLYMTIKKSDLYSSLWAGNEHLGELGVEQFRISAILPSSTSAQKDQAHLTTKAGNEQLKLALPHFWLTLGTEPPGEWPGSGLIFRTLCLFHQTGRMKSI
jgi:hypothetical protein